MHLLFGRLILSATDLAGFLNCGHLTAQELRAARGEIERPQRDDPELDVVTRRGEAHESWYLQKLRGDGRRIVEIRTDAAGLEAYTAAEAATLAAMRAGVDVIYQATFFDGRWLGRADFLERVDGASDLGSYHYEVVDTKLARRARSIALLQTCLYSQQLLRLQGVEPERMHLVLGDRTRASFRVRDYSAYLEEACARLEAALTSGSDIYPEPVEHCGVCRWSEVCAARRRRDDHLSLVAGMRRDVSRKLGEAGVTTVAELSALPAGIEIPGVAPGSLAKVRAQAGLQVRQRQTGEPCFDVLEPPAPASGLAALPPPSPGDLFFDMEGDPYALTDGLEYLFGVVEVESGSPIFSAFWAHSREEEKVAFEALIDFVIERLRRDPDLHVYHYGSYEAAALKRLMGAHATREAEVDRLLRGGVLVDLYQVVRNAVRVSQESYSIKKLEPYYMPARDSEIADAGSSIVAYEKWLETGDTNILDAIRDYNRDDCVSTWSLRQWLEELRAKSIAGGVAIDRPAARPPDPSEAQREWEGELQTLTDRLLCDIPEERTERSPDQQAVWLLAQSLWFHRREQKSQWWAHFARLAMTPEELFEDVEAISGLAYGGEVARVKRSTVHRYRFDPRQEHKILVGQVPIDFHTHQPAGTVVAIDPVEGCIDIKRATGSAVPHPAALIPPSPIADRVLREGVRRVAEWVAAHGLEEPGPYRAVLDLLRGSPPRVQGIARGSPLSDGNGGTGDAAVALASRLDGACLPVQGPPGTGKTYTGARMIVRLVAEGRRVGITANSHKVIVNLLDAVCREAQMTGDAVRPVQKSEDGQASASAGVLHAGANEAVAAALSSGEANVAAGTAWLFASEAMAGLLDVVMVDEAGQVPLANILATAGATANLVLLGDPNQLAQPIQGAHPPGAAVSALQHVLGGEATIAPERGLFLGVTRRMHPDVCAFISDIAYDRRLVAEASCSRQRAGGDDWLAGTGLRYLPVEHSGNRTSSPEEGAAVAEIVRPLSGRFWTDRTGVERRIGLEDILVVAPYNAHVSLLTSLLPAGARIGTVDKFQGQEAAIVVYSLATSSPAELPRNAEFLYSLNRLNVAISRARALAVLVCSPALLGVWSASPEQIRLANALCRFTAGAGVPAVDGMITPADRLA